MIDPMVAGYLGIACLIILLVLGVHIGVALGLVGMFGVASIVGFEAAFFTSAGSIYHKIASFDLVTIPLFIMMGYLASGGGMSKNVFETLGYWVGHIRGGLGIATVASCTAFGTVCGSSLVTAAVFAKMCAPEMRKHGYDGRIAYGICASGGMIGMLIPPSILMVVYGVLAGESIGKLLIAGVVPGLLLMILFSLAIVVTSWARPKLIQKTAGTAKGNWRLRMTSLVKIWQILLVALIIFGGIFGGVFNPTEAGAVATVSLLILMLITKLRQSPGLMKEGFLETGATTAMIFLVMGGAAVFSHFLVLTGITGNLAVYIISLDLSRLTLIWVLAVFYGVLGCFLDSISMLAITIPLFNPVISAMGIDPIYYAVVVVMAIEAGLITPPVGLNVYGAFAVAEKDIRLEDIFLGVVPFFIMCWLAIAILIFWPGLSTFLPSLMLGN
jgi:tripartite ATP-independent transporter DctM subunit